MDALSTLTPPSNMLQGTDGVSRDEMGAVWIASKAHNLQLRLIINAHNGTGGQRGKHAAQRIVGENFVWDRMKKDIDVFVTNFLHCLVTRTGEVIPRPLASALHGSTPNDVLYKDYLYMGNAADSDFKYVLVRRDDLSSFKWLFPTAAPIAEKAGETLSSSVSTFGTM